MLDVTLDDPGKTLTAGWAGGDPKLAKRIGVSLLWAPFLLFVLGYLLACLRFILSGAIFTNPGSVLELLFSSLFVLFPGLMLFGSSQGMSYWKRVSWDVEPGELSISRFGYLLWRTSKLCIPLERIHKVKFEIGPETRDGSPVLVVCHLSYREEESEDDKTLSFGYEVEGMELRTEAMALVFRVAHIAEWPGYAVRRSDPRRLDLELIRKGRGRRIPALGQRVQSSSESAEAGEDRRASKPAAMAPAVEQSGLEVEAYRVPETKVEPFDVHLLGWPYTKNTWEPGRLVHLLIPPLTPAQKYWSGGCFGVVVGLIWLFPSFTGRELHPYVLTFLGIASAVVVLFVFFGDHLVDSREARIDWESGLAFFQYKKEKRSVSLDEIEGIILRGHSMVRTEGLSSDGGARGGSGSRRSYPVYWCDVEVALPGPDIVIHRTGKIAENSDMPYLQSLPMVVELANALGVPWDWEGYR